MKKTILTLMGIALIATTSLIYSCDKEDSVLNHETKPSIKASADRSADGLIPILEVQKGKKKGEIFHKYCVSGKGTCFLWFGGMFLTESYDFNRTFPCNLSTNSNGGGFLESKTAGVHAAHVVKDSLDLLYDFSCVDERDAEDWIMDIKDGFSNINDTIVFDEDKVLDVWNLKSPVAIPSGSYPIKSYNIATSQFFIRVPIFKVK